MKRFLITCLMLVMFPTLVFAVDAKEREYHHGSKAGTIPVTGQLLVYGNYDDGYFQAGWVSIPRFVDNGDGTISDRTTGLMWVKQPELIIPGAPDVVAGNQITLADGTWNPSYHPAGCVVMDITENTFWIAAVNVSPLGPVWENSHLYTVGEDVRSAGGPTWYKCSQEHTSSAAPAIMEDDVSNHPEWWAGDYYPDFAAQRTAQPTYWRNTNWTASADNLVTPAVPLFWLLGVWWCDSNAGFVYAGYSDWRCPNITELNSLVDYVAPSAPPINVIFPNTQVAYYWSSTESPFYVSSYAMTVDFLLGGSSDNDETVPLAYVRPVRGGQ